MLQYSFLSALFQGVGKVILGLGVTLLPVNQAGLGPPDPTKMAP